VKPDVRFPPKIPGRGPHPWDDSTLYRFITGRECRGGVRPVLRPYANLPFSRLICCGLSSALKKGPLPVAVDPCQHPAAGKQRPETALVSREGHNPTTPSQGTQLSRPALRVFSKLRRTEPAKALLLAIDRSTMQVPSIHAMHRGLQQAGHHACRLRGRPRPIHFLAKEGPILPWICSRPQHKLAGDEKQQTTCNEAL
jgi:hypothetical protein